MQVRIVGNGDPTGTKIFTEDGRDISDCITGITISHCGGDLPIADVRLALFSFEMQCEARMLGPDGKEVSRIIYKDGSEDHYDGVVEVSGMGEYRKFAEP